jgi:hypothetical protein
MVVGDELYGIIAHRGAITGIGEPCAQRPQS